MSKPFVEKMQTLKKVVSILLILDVIGMILVGIELFSTFQMLAGYGQFMMVVAIVIVAMVVGIQLFEILTKVFMIRSTSPTFSWSSGRKRYVTAVRFLLLLNFGAVVVNLLSVGGEGATWINQGRLYLQILASVVEIMVAFVYLRTVKRHVKEITRDSL